MGWKLTDTGETYHLELSNGALIHIPTSNPPAADLTVTLTRPQLVTLLFTGNTDGIELTGDRDRPADPAEPDRQSRPELPHRHPLTRPVTARPVTAHPARELTGCGRG